MDILFRLFEQNILVAQENLLESMKDIKMDFRELIVFFMVYQPFSEESICFWYIDLFLYGLLNIFKVFLTL